MCHEYSDAVEELYVTIKCAACTQNMTYSSSTIIPTIHGTFFHTLSICFSMERTYASSTMIPTVHGTFFRTLSICISMERRVVSVTLEDI
jgi:hypothetical protein